MQKDPKFAWKQEQKLAEFCALCSERDCAMMGGRSPMPFYDWMRLLYVAHVCHFPEVNQMLLERNMEKYRVQYYNFLPAEGSAISLYRTWCRQFYMDAPNEYARQKLKPLLYHLL